MVKTRITTQTGQPFRLVRPLDFVVVADHAENIGISDCLERADPLIMQSEAGKKWAEMVKDGKGYDAALDRFRRKVLQRGNARGGADDGHGPRL